VQRVILEQNYHPNSAGRALASRRSQIIGLLIPQQMGAVFSDPYFPTLIQGISAAVQEHGFWLSLSFLTEECEETFRRTIRGRHLDGAVIATALAQDPFVQRLEEEQFPFVLIGRSPNPLIATTIDADNARGAEMAVQHLVRLGHTRIATITGPLRMTAAMDRRDGYLGAIRAAGLALPEHYIQEGDWTEASGHQAMSALLRCIPRPEAVFSASDAMAIGALKALRSAGARVPEDMAVVGFDDVPMASAVDPPLTTIRQPIGRLGYTAAVLLLDQLIAPTAARSSEGQYIVLPTELIIRESCGQARRYAPERLPPLHPFLPTGGAAAG
jgi:LacI family transcriptional regulator